MIRRATIDDLDGIMPMAERFYTTCPWAKVAAYDAEASRAGMAALLESENAGIFVIDDAGTLRGSFGAVLTPVWLAADFIIAQEVFWWVEPEVTREALTLWRAGEAWAESSGAKAGVMIRLHGMQDEALHRLYERRGYNPLEYSYVKRYG